MEAALSKKGRGFKDPATERLIEKVKPFLEQYLRDCGVDFTSKGRFKCINPDHDDGDPSSQINKRSQGCRTKCWSCGAGYNIFQVAALLEKKPSAGPGWLHQNLYYLARKYGLEFEERELTEEELLYMKVAAMYDDAADILLDYASDEQYGDKYIKHALDRGFTRETCAEYGMASVPWGDMAVRLRAAGHDLELCRQYSLHEEYFDEDSITILLRDPNGMAVGFATRWLKYSKESAKLAKAQGQHYRQKWLNTSHKVPFFHRDSLVFGLDKAKKHAGKRLDVYEGYFDVLMARQAGYMPCVCGSGTTFTEMQVNTVREHGFNWANIVYDGDDEGIKAARKTINSMAGYEGLKATVMFLIFPDTVAEKDRDPDVYIRMFGLEAYLQVQPMSAFEWKLSDALAALPADPNLAAVERHSIAEQMVPLLMNEMSVIERSRLCEVLAYSTGVPLEDVRGEVKRRSDVRIKEISEDTIRQLGRAKDAVAQQEILRRANAALDLTNDKVLDFSAEETLKHFTECCLRYESVTDELSGWDTGWPLFNNNFDGLKKYDEVFAIAGGANSGKTAFLTTLTANLISKNPVGLSVIYHSLDDPRNMVYAKLMACLTGLPIRYITKANKLLPTITGGWDRYNQARAFLEQAIRAGRLIVKGRELGEGISAAEGMIVHAQQKYGNQVVYMGDSFHSLDSEGGEEERIRYKRVAEWSMKVAELQQCTLVYTVELRKTRELRPTIEDLAESGKLSYAFKGIGLVYNDLHSRRENAQTFWVDDSVSPIIQRPILEIAWVKNKVTEYKGNSYFKLWDNVARLEELDVEKLKAEKDKAKTLKKPAPNEEALASLAVETVLPDLEHIHGNEATDTRPAGPPLGGNPEDKGQNPWD